MADGSLLPFDESTDVLTAPSMVLSGKPTITTSAAKPTKVPSAFAVAVSQPPRKALRAQAVIRQKQRFSNDPSISSSPRQTGNEVSISRTSLVAAAFVVLAISKYLLF